MWKCWQAGCIGGLRTWPFRGRYDKGASAPALPGHWTLHFWDNSDIQIISKFFGSARVETLAPGIVWGQNFSSVCASATWLMVFCCLWKTTQYLIRKWTSLGLVLRLQKEPLVLKMYLISWSRSPWELPTFYPYMIALSGFTHEKTAGRLSLRQHLLGYIGTIFLLSEFQSDTCIPKIMD